ncbi:uncharacterized protein PSANT_02924 [Moesziomyces antarcticus]|uniref:Uncharacterized protein n=1 Tax=Pseudozyma antarctica TaxID=84753 RepID=A0A5C3FLI1_PSEA2|nr:uncharacterized protein PSANT_02924 [Moesziomyces antarcticus]
MPDRERDVRPGAVVQRRQRAAADRLRTMLTAEFVCCSEPRLRACMHPCQPGRSLAAVRTMLLGVEAGPEERARMGCTMAGGKVQHLPARPRLGQTKPSTSVGRQPVRLTTSALQVASGRHGAALFDMSRWTDRVQGGGVRVGQSSRAGRAWQLHAACCTLMDRRTVSMATLLACCLELSPPSHACTHARPLETLMRANVRKPASASKP